MLTAGTKDAERDLCLLDKLEAKTSRSVLVRVSRQLEAQAQFAFCTSSVLIKLSIYTYIVWKNTSTNDNDLRWFRVFNAQLKQDAMKSIWKSCQLSFATCHLLLLLSVNHSFSLPLPISFFLAPPLSWLLALSLALSPSLSLSFPLSLFLSIYQDVDPPLCLPFSRTFLLLFSHFLSFTHFPVSSLFRSVSFSESLWSVFHSI